MYIYIFSYQESRKKLDKFLFQNRSYQKSRDIKVVFLFLKENIFQKYSTDF